MIVHIAIIEGVCRRRRSSARAFARSQPLRPALMRTRTFASDGPLCVRRPCRAEAPRFGGQERET